MSLRVHARVVGGLVAIASLAFVPPTIGASQERGEAVQAFSNAFVAAVRAYDVDAWSELVTDDIVMMTPAGDSTEGRAAFEAVWRRTFSGRTGRNPLQVSVRDIAEAGGKIMVRADYGPEGRDPVGIYFWLLARDPAGDLKLEWWAFTRP